MSAFTMIAACHTPFHPDGSLNLALVPKQAELFRRNGVDGVFCCGTTGEGPSLTTAERKEVAAAWAAHRGSLKLIVHVGHSCGRDAADLAAHAKSIGVDAVAACAPTFFKPPTAADLVEFMAPVAAACAPLPFLYYDLPSVTGVRLSAAEFLHIAAVSIPNVGGVKFTNIDAVTVQECVTAGGGRYAVYWGVDEMLLSALAVGVRSAVGSTYNFTSTLHREIAAAFDGEDVETAARLQRESVRMIRVLEKYGGMVTGGKAVMGLYGIDCGPVRSPLVPLSAEQVAKLWDEVRGLAALNPLGERA